MNALDLYNNTHSLGLAKKTRVQAQGRDAVENVSQIPFEDPEVERICHEHDVYTIDDAAQVTSIKGWWYNSKHDIKTLNELKYFTGLKSVEAHAFANYYSLQSIVIPDSVTSIEKYAFYNCYSLQTINIPDSVTKIGEWTFCCCRSLQSINIPNSVTSIGEKAFHSCSSLQSINIPDSVTNIGFDAFYNCDSLQSIFISKNCPIYNKIKEKYPYIQLVEPSVNESDLGLAKKTRQQAQGRDAVDIMPIVFKDQEAQALCHSVGVYTIQDAAELTELPEEYFSENDDLMWFPELKYFTRITEIPNYCFKGDRFVGDIILPSAGNLRVLGEYAFAYCFELDKIDIPEGVEEIKRCCFKECRELKVIKIPSTIKYIAPNSFDNCNKIEELIVPSCAKEDLGDSIQYIVNFINNHCNNKNNIKITWIDSISESHSLGLAKKTRQQAQGKDAIENVNASDIPFIEDEVRELCNEIDVYTFEDAAKTKTLDYAKGIFSDRGFEQFPEFQYFTSIEEVPAEFFYDNTLLYNIKLPASGNLHAIRGRAFKNCSSLEEIVIPEGVDSIGTNCFFGCSELKKITLPSTIRVIAKDAFNGCTSLKAIYMHKKTFSSPLVFNDLLFAVYNIGHGVREYFEFKCIEDEALVTESNLGLAKKARAQAEDKDPVDNLNDDSWVLMEAPAWSNYDSKTNDQFRKKFPDRELYVYSSGWGIYQQMILVKLSEVKDIDSIYNWSRWAKTKKLYKIPRKFKIDAPIEEIKKYVSDNCEYGDFERIDFSLRESNLGLAKKVSKEKEKVTSEDTAEQLLTITEEDITYLYNKWGHLLIKASDEFWADPTRRPSTNLRTTFDTQTGRTFKSIESRIRESYSKFITDMTDGDMMFNHNNSWGQEGHCILEFYDYRVIKNRRSLKNSIYFSYTYYGDYRQYMIDFVYERGKHMNLIKDWYIPETVKCLQKNPEFIHYFLSKLGRKAVVDK